MTLLLKVSVVGIFLVLARAAAQEGAEEGSWGYATRGDQSDPQHWYLSYEVCNGTRQSPINIECSDIRADQDLKPLVFQNYDKLVKGLIMHNDGHTLKVAVPAEAGLRLIGDSLPATYRLSQFHFHWGTKLKGGSEHAINKKRWPLELHLVHVNENIPASETTMDRNGMVVVSVLFGDKKKNAQNEQPSELMELLSTSAAKCINEDDQTTLPDMVLGNLLPDNHTVNYLRYSGSLTTPPCAEVVEWIVLTGTMATSAKSLTQFRRTRRHLHGSDTTKNGKEKGMQENNRPLQPLNERPIRLMGELGPSIPKCEINRN